MDGFAAARILARERHAAMLARTEGVATAEALILAAEAETGISCFAVTPRDPLLCGAEAILMRDAFSIAEDPWRGDREERFISREIIPVPDADLIEQSATRVAWPTKAIQAAAKAADEKGYAVALVHSHPSGPLRYSDLDDAEEPGAIDIIFNRNGGVRPHLSLLMDGRGEMIGRAYDPQLKAHPLSMLRVLGERFVFRYPGRDAEAGAFLDRQRRAFGRAFCNDMRALRIGVVGCGATGSATVALLMRLGAGHLALFDNDVVDRTNLNRLHFARQPDADIGARKVDVLARQVAVTWSRSLTRLRDLLSRRPSSGKFRWLAPYLERLGLVSRPDFLATFVEDHPRPADMAPDRFYVVMTGPYPKWAAFRCPCGCGDVIDISVAQGPRSWKLHVDWIGRPSLRPSVWRHAGCFAHFWLTRGQVRWCRDTGKPVERR